MPSGPISPSVVHDDVGGAGIWVPLQPPCLKPPSTVQRSAKAKLCHQRQVSWWINFGCLGENTCPMGYTGECVQMHKCDHFHLVQLCCWVRVSEYFGGSGERHNENSCPLYQHSWKTSTCPHFLRIRLRVSFLLHFAPVLFDTCRYPLDLTLLPTVSLYHASHTTSASN